MKLNIKKRYLEISQIDNEVTLHNTKLWVIDLATMIPVAIGSQTNDNKAVYMNNVLRIWVSDEEISLSELISRMHEWNNVIHLDITGLYLDVSREKTLWTESGTKVIRESKLWLMKQTFESKMQSLKHFRRK